MKQLLFICAVVAVVGLVALVALVGCGKAKSISEFLPDKRFYVMPADAQPNQKEWVYQFDKGVAGAATDGKYHRTKYVGEELRSTEYGGKELAYNVATPTVVYILDDVGEVYRIHFPSPRPKKGDKVAWGSNNVIITKIEDASPLKSSE